MLQIFPEIALQRMNLRTRYPIVWLVLFASTAVSIILRSLPAQRVVFSPILFIPFLALAILNGKALFDVYWHSRRSYSQHQESLLLGDTRFLASEQPNPKQQTLPSHIIISWRTRIDIYVFMYIFFSSILLALIMPFFVFLLSSSQLVDLSLRLGFVLVGIPVITTLYRKWISHKSQSKVQEHQEDLDEDAKTIPTDGFSLLNEQFVDVDEESLTLYAPGKGYIDIPWEEARLFCIVSSDNRANGQYTYALVSENHCAKWVDAPSQSFWPPRRYRPWLPDAQHQKKTQELLQFIVARTGLPLYDLRIKV